MSGELQAVMMMPKPLEFERFENLSRSPRDCCHRNAEYFVIPAKAGIQLADSTGFPPSRERQYRFDSVIPNYGEFAIIKTQANSRLIKRQEGA